MKGRTHHSFQNRLLRKIFGPKREEVTGGWRRLHIKELHNMYSLPNFSLIMSRRVRWAGNVAWISWIAWIFQKPEGKKSSWKT
jgi:hypothetical protein